MINYREHGTPPWRWHTGEMTENISQKNFFFFFWEKVKNKFWRTFIITREYDDFILYLHVDFAFGVANKYCVKTYFERSWFCILLRNVFLIFVCVLLFGFFFVVNNLCAFYNCLQIEDLNLKFEKKRKTTQKNLQNFITILMNRFHSSKEKNTFFEKIKSESIYHQDKRNPNSLWLFWRQLVMNQSKTRFHRPRRSPFGFFFLASIRLLPGSRLEKLQEKIWMQNW